MSASMQSRSGKSAVVPLACLGVVAFGALTPLAFLSPQFGGQQISVRSTGQGFAEPVLSSRDSTRGFVSAAVASAALAAAAAAAARGSSRMPRRCEGAAEGAAETPWRTAEQISAMTQSVGAGVVDNVEIAKILPHRYPFLLVDKVIHLEKMKRAVGIKNVTANEPQFTGHFPDRPIMPGVLMVEALAQLAGVVCMSPGDQVLFAGIDGVKFKRPVVPGDTLVMEVEVLKFRESAGIAKMSGKAYVDGKLAIVVAEFTCALIKKANVV